MFDEHSRKTIEECLLAAEDAMERASIGVMRTSMEKPHGFTLLVHFDDDYHFTRVYRPGHGMAPFRSFIRATPNTAEYDRKTFDLLVQLGELESYFRPFLAEQNMEIPQITKHYVKKELRFGDTAAWPDDLYYNLTFKADELFRNSTGYMPPRVVDLSEISPKELQAVPNHLRYENAIKNAIDLVCMGPWAGFSISRIIWALKKLHDDLNQGKRDVEPPIVGCLESRTAGRLTIPLWRAGRFHGVFSVVIGGSLEQLDPLDGLVSECVSVSHLLFSVLQRERERRARMRLRSGLLHQDRPFIEAIRHAAHVLAAPHHVRDVKVTDGKNNSSGSSFGEDGNTGPPLRFTVEETLFDQRVRIEVELFDEERKIIRDLMKIYISNELRRIHWEISTGLTAATGADGKNQSSFQTPAEVEEKARKVLKENENDPKLPNKKYALCLLSLAILKQRGAPVVKIFGNMNDTYQAELASGHKIFRNTKQTSKTNKSQFLSHVFDQPALDYVRRHYPGLEITKKFSLVEARFGHGQEFRRPQPAAPRGRRLS